MPFMVSGTIRSFHELVPLRPLFFDDYLLDNSERGIWVLSPKGKQVDSVDPRQVVRYVQEIQKDKKSTLLVKSVKLPVDVEGTRALEAFKEEVEEETWRGELLDRLLNISPDAFERLCQRLLRESGFVEVKVTGRSGMEASTGLELCAWVVY